MQVELLSVILIPGGRHHCLVRAWQQPQCLLDDIDRESRCEVDEILSSAIHISENGVYALPIPAFSRGLGGGLTTVHSPIAEGFAPAPSRLAAKFHVLPNPFDNH